MLIGCRSGLPGCRPRRKSLAAQYLAIAADDQSEYEWHDGMGKWHRSYGNEMWEFDEQGLMARRYASMNDAPIRWDERRVFPRRAGGGGA